MQHDRGSLLYSNTNFTFIWTFWFYLHFFIRNVHLKKTHELWKLEEQKIAFWSGPFGIDSSFSWCKIHSCTFEVSMYINEWVKIYVYRYFNYEVRTFTWICTYDLSKARETVALETGIPTLQRPKITQCVKLVFYMTAVVAILFDICLHMKSQMSINKYVWGNAVLVSTFIPIGLLLVWPFCVSPPMH